MGLLSAGTPMQWQDARTHAAHVRRDGIVQFLAIYNRLKGRTRDNLLWGDEVEYCVVSFEGAAPALALDAHAILEKLQKINDSDSSWNPEWGNNELIIGRFMLEGTPRKPYGDTLEDLLSVEDNMRQRRLLASSLLPENQAVMSLTHFPLMGSGRWCLPYYPPTPFSGYSHSIFVCDEAIGLHARFRTLVENIRVRRGSNVAINVPIYRDLYTANPFLEQIPYELKKEIEERTGSAAPSVLTEFTSDAQPNHIYMDAMAFGMGSSCLQVTFQACSIEQGRRLYDQLIPITPLMLALSASSPIYRGYLSDVDCRWDVICASVDDRTREERGLDPLQNSKFRIHKSRYDSVSRYLSPGPNVSGGCGKNPNFTSVPKGSEFYQDIYNDVPVAFDHDIYKQLLEGGKIVIEIGVDELLAKHYAHLFIRDPLVIYRELLQQNNEESTDHFENLQSTNWLNQNNFRQTMRFKPPPPNSKIGWRVEFRSMDIQPTDFQNAAFSIFVVLLTRTILHFNLNFYTPLSMVDLNMKLSQTRDAINTAKFWFRDDIQASETSKSAKDSFSMLTIDEIMNGTPKSRGLCSLVDQYIDEENLDAISRLKIKRYVNFVRQRADGTIPTQASWTRSFVETHPLYQKDSVVTGEIANDLLRAILDLEVQQVAPVL